MKPFNALLIIASIAFASSIQAQECKFEFNTVDKFTGKPKVGDFYVLTGGHMLYFQKSEGEYTMELITQAFNGYIRQGVEQGSEGQFRLSNGEFITFIVKENAVATVTQNYSTKDMQSKFTVKFSITEEEMIKFSNSAPVAYNFPLGSVSVKNDLPEKRGMKIMKTASCLLQYN